MTMLTCPAYSPSHILCTRLVRDSMSSAGAGQGLSSTPLPHHTSISPLVDRPPAHERTTQLGKQLVSPEAMELIQAMDKSLVTPARSESGFPGPLTLPVDISGNVLTGGFQAVCAGASSCQPLLSLCPLSLW